MTDRRILSLYWQANRRYPRLVAGVLVTLIVGVGVGVGVDFAVPLLVAAACLTASSFRWRRSSPCRPSGCSRGV